MEEMSYVFLSSFFVTAVHFHLGGRWHFLISHRRYKSFMLFFKQKNVSFGLLSLALTVCRSFSVELRWPVAFFIFFSVFEICRHDNWPKLILRQHLNRNNLCFPFSFLHKTRVAMRFPAKITSSCHTCWLSYFTLVCPWCGRTVDLVTTKFSRMHRLPNFLTHGSPLLARAPL